MASRVCGLKLPCYREYLKVGQNLPRRVGDFCEYVTLFVASCPRLTHIMISSTWII